MNALGTKYPWRFVFDVSTHYILGGACVLLILVLVSFLFAGRIRKLDPGHFLSFEKPA